MKCIAAISILLAAGPTPPAPPAGRPHIVFILADDMGYGDPKCFNPESKCNTPNIDRLATQGMRFTDAHAAGTVCIPSRYGLLTGRYPFREANLDPAKRALIDAGRTTVATLLHEQGYRTRMIGKWHEGFVGGDRFDYAKPLRGGPIDHGFDYFFGQHASLDIPPYFYIENDRCVAAPSQHIDEHHTPGWSPVQGAFWRAGDIAADFKLEDVLPTYTRKAVEYLDGRGKASSDKRSGGKSGDEMPFFLYVALTGPHTPWLPMEQFRAKSAGNLYTQFVEQVDDSVGQVLTAIDRNGLASSTLVFFSSDNGPVWYPDDVKKYDHCAAGIWRGMKGDAWEGGHREPLIARWPGKIAAGSTSKSLIDLTDLMATFAELTGATPPKGAGEDSISFLPVLLGTNDARPARQDLAIFAGGHICLREGDWKLIPYLGSGGFSKPAKIKPKSGEPVGQLYNLASDPGETQNVYAQHPDIVREMTERSARIGGPALSAARRTGRPDLIQVAEEASDGD